jgi:hypothetical protein
MLHKLPRNTLLFAPSQHANPSKAPLAGVYARQIRHLDDAAAVKHPLHCGSTCHLSAAPISIVIRVPSSKQCDLLRTPAFWRSMKTFALPRATPACIVCH